MSEQRTVSRRSALTGVGAGGLGLALGSRLAGASAGAQTGSVADHPLIGIWMAMVTLPSAPDVAVAVPSIYSADGSVLLVFPVSQVGPNGVQLKSVSVGTWEAVDERRGHFTAVQSLTDVDGNYLGSMTIDGYPAVSEDGQTFEDQSPDALITIRDAANAIVATVEGGSPNPVLGIRMGAGNPGFPEIPGEATPDR
ncbi:MAG: hypothetical protein M3440_05965 [Chloroflexota bacterium]|nr:hypothetical protein [Chloroflexota bacterium]